MDERMAWKDRCGEKGENRAQELVKKTMLILIPLVKSMKELKPKLLFTLLANPETS
jgi:hypothetical protein